MTACWASASEGGRESLGLGDVIGIGMLIVAGMEATAGKCVVATDGVDTALCPPAGVEPFLKDAYEVVGRGKTSGGRCADPTPTSDVATEGEELEALNVAYDVNGRGGGAVAVTDEEVVKPWSPGPCPNA